MTTVALYARLSKDRYKGEVQEGIKVEQQLAECRAWASSRGWTVSAEFTDNDISATTGKRRPGFEALLDHMHAGEADAIVCWHTDRLARLTKDLERVIDLDVAVHGLHAGHLDLSTPAGRAVARTVTAWAQYEGEQKAVRFALATQRRIEAGVSWWPSAPMGFTQDQKPSKDADLVRQAYKDLIDGHTLSAIARAWNEAGITTPKGARWYTASVGELLRAPRNAGLLEHKGVVVGEAAWDGLVDVETWNAAQAILRAPERRSGGPRRLTYLLSSLALCGICHAEGKDVPVWSGAHKRGLRHYRCSDAAHNMRKAQEAEDWVIASTLFLLTRPDATSLVEDKDLAARAALLIERKRLEDQALEIESAYLAGSLDMATMLRLKAGITTGLEQTGKALADADRAAVFSAFVTTKEVVYPSDLEGARKAWDELPLGRQQEILRAIWERIVLKPSKQARTFNPDSIDLVPAGGTSPFLATWTSSSEAS